MSEINLVDFFRFYEHTQEQQKAVEMLQAVMPSSLLTDASPWVVQYREKPPAPQWPITKEQMGSIMNCSANSLPDSLMDDRQVRGHSKMDKLAIGYFLWPMRPWVRGLHIRRDPRRRQLRRAQRPWKCRSGDGVKFAGTGWIQVKAFAHVLLGLHVFDRPTRPEDHGDQQDHSSEKYPERQRQLWRFAGMNNFCAARPQHTNYQIDVEPVSTDECVPTVLATASTTRTKLLTYSAFELMDDVSLAWRIEMNRRAIEKSNDPTELRRLANDCICLMKAQRNVLREMLREMGLK